MRPCSHPDVPRPDECKVCWHYVNAPGFKEYYDAFPAVTKGLTLECIHLGDVLNSRGCDCKWKWVHECDVFGSCTRADQTMNLKVCATCKSYSAGPL